MLFRFFVPFIETQKVSLWSTFLGKEKSLENWRFCSTFAVDFAKKMKAVNWALAALARYTLLIYVCA